MRDPFHTGQILEIEIGERVDNKLYRAQVTQADSRTVILHVPGFDHLRFVDLLKGTAVTLRAQWNGKPHIGRSKLAEHFKDSSPHVVIRRPSALEPIFRNAQGRIEAELDMTYATIEERLIRRAEPVPEKGGGEIRLRRVPEPFDVGTPLSLRVAGTGANPLSIKGWVAHVARDPEDPSRYAILFSVGALDSQQKERLLEILLQSTGGAAGADKGEPGGEGD